MPRFVLLAAASLLTATAALAVQSAPQRGVGVDIAGVDKAAQPGDGFDHYANGGWRARTEIPADRAAIGSFLTAALLVEQRNIEIITNAGRDSPAAGSNARKIADYYAAYLDRAAIDARGAAPLQPLLARIDDIRPPPAFRRSGRRMRADRRSAERHQLRHREPLRRLRRARLAGAAPAISLICSRGAWAFPTAIIISPKRPPWPGSAMATAPISARC